MGLRGIPPSLSKEFYGCSPRQSQRLHLGFTWCTIRMSIAGHPCYPQYSEQPTASTAQWKNVWEKESNVIRMGEKQVAAKLWNPRWWAKSGKWGRAVARKSRYVTPFVWEMSLLDLLVIINKWLAQAWDWLCRWCWTHEWTLPMFIWHLGFKIALLSKTTCWILSFCYSFEWWKHFFLFIYFKWRVRI